MHNRLLILQTTKSFRTNAPRANDRGERILAHRASHTVQTVLAIARLAFVVSLAGVATGHASTPTPRFDPRTLRSTIAGPPTQVMVLGTAHLSEISTGYKVEYLEPLLDRLAQYRPDIITIESLSGPDCDVLVRYKAVDPGVAEEYCADPTAAQKTAGLDVPAAEAEVAATLKAWPAAPNPVDRRHLAALFLAANDRSSATVQWLRLPIDERRPGDGIDDGLAAILEKTSTSTNENIRIGAVLAARLGLERVFAVDDHSADSIIASLGPHYEKAIQQVWNGPYPFIIDYKAKLEAIRSAADLLAVYRFMNDPRTNRSAIASDMEPALRQVTPELYGRQYVAWWETRNLRMVANILAASANRPGARVLSVVGATHKAYFETYLDMMSDVQLIDTKTVLK